MNESKISVRYAKALFQLSKDEKQLKKAKNDMELVLEYCTSISDFWLMLESPVIKTSKKQELVKQVFSSKISTLTLDFLDLVLRNKRESFLKDIVRNFLTFYRKDQNIKSAVFSSAVTIKEDDRKRLLTLLEKTLNCHIELEERIDGNLIGGFVLRIEDKQLDASVANQLDQIKRELLNPSNLGKN